ncbi:MAG TPA: LacI family DNA-binding transcriptional regulator [Alphaproteobacteria bacterium]|nr:LacI family DNA-binding transcriptional regulator [Alphaproteobacteria bacterium]
MADRSFRRSRKSPARAPGRRCTIKDVAREARVSAGTVSRVTSNNPTVQPHIRARVAAAIEKLGYRPSAAAQSMRTAATKLIGCIVSDFSNPLYSAILRSAESILSAKGYTLIIASSDDQIEREIALFETFARRRVDGVIAVLSDEGAPRLVRTIETAGFPVLLMERDAHFPADVIATDHAGGMRRAVEHLIALGHRRIALLTGSTRTRSGRDRAAGYRAAHAAVGIPLDESLLRCESLTTAFAFEETQRLFALEKPPTAIIAGGNLMLAGVLRALKLLDQSIPDDVSVISAGETELAELATPSVTVIRWDLVAFGHEAATLMLQRVSNPDAPHRRIVVPCELVMRKSCAAPPR